ncbi:hypothetical protein D0463_08825 [Bacillus sp. V59.32b]|nr:hypothetical protein D0463_08825 [Bacillus sp. V59.32b]
MWICLKNRPRQLVAARLSSLARLNAIPQVLKEENESLKSQIEDLKARDAVIQEDQFFIMETL